MKALKIYIYSTLIVANHSRTHLSSKVLNGPPLNSLLPISDPKANVTFKTLTQNRLIRIIKYEEYEKGY